jgi:hypothetical protein
MLRKLVFKYCIYLHDLDKWSHQQNRHIWFTVSIKCTPLLKFSHISDQQIANFLGIYCYR